MTDKLFITKMNEIRERIRSTLGAVTLTDFIEELLEDRKWLFERLEIAANYDPSEKLRIERDELADRLRSMCNMWASVCSANGHDPEHMTQYQWAMDTLSRIGKDNK